MPTLTIDDYSLPLQTVLDPSLPEMTDSMRSNYTEGFPLLQADVQEDLHRTRPTLALGLKIFARNSLLETESSASSPISTTAVAQTITTPCSTLEYRQKYTARMIETAFEPLTTIHETLRSTQPSAISVLDGPIHPIASDVAPYVRSIVAYDIRLEQQRLALSNLLSQGGRAGKKLRTTRASRAALEGGSKASTRRERWFPKDLSFAMVMRTGGDGWQEAALRLAQGEEVGSVERSRQESLASEETAERDED